MRSRLFWLLLSGGLLLLAAPADIQKRQHQLKARFLDALGGFPERTPLNARTVGTEQRDGSARFPAELSLAPRFTRQA
jgi:hypothetical protein